MSNPFTHAFMDEISKIAKRSYVKDFAAGVDPTGLSSTSYGATDVDRTKRDQKIRRGIGTAGGFLGGAIAVPSLISGIIGGISGMSGGGFRGAGRGFVKGLHRPISSTVRGIRGLRTLRKLEKGKQITPKQVGSLRKLVTTEIPGLSGRKLPKAIKDRHIASVLTPAVVNTPKGKEAVKGARRLLRERVGEGVAALGLSGGVGGAGAYLQYGKGLKAGERMTKKERQKMREERGE